MTGDVTEKAEQFIEGRVCGTSRYRTLLRNLASKRIISHYSSGDMHCCRLGKYLKIFRRFLFMDAEPRSKEWLNLAVYVQQIPWKTQP